MKYSLDFFFSQSSFIKKKKLKMYKAFLVHRPFTKTGKGQNWDHWPQFANPCIIRAIQ